jgi:hypothetical protein
MADQDDVRRIALALPGTTEDPTSFRFLVAGKAFAWVWLERFAPKGPRIANAGVLAVRVAGETEKDDLLALDSSVFFTEPHYDGFPAILGGSRPSTRRTSPTCSRGPGASRRRRDSGAPPTRAEVADRAPGHDGDHTQWLS